ncbi:MAG: type IV pilus modification protein PilV [Lysobacterales bacterium]
MSNRHLQKPHPPGRVGPRAQQRGATMVEIMIAVFILAVGLLGVAALQASALRNSGSALERSQAVIQTYSILDAMRANLTVARAGGYNMDPATTATPPTNGGALAVSDRVAWQVSLQATLGGIPSSAINCVASICTITVQWNDSRGTNADATAAASYQVITVSQL